MTAPDRGQAAQMVAALAADVAAGRLDPELYEPVRLLVAAVMADAVDVDELSRLLGAQRPGGEPVTRQYAGRLAREKGFPDPLLQHRHLSVWARWDVLTWLTRRTRG